MRGNTDQKISEYGPVISLYSVQMRDNTDQKNSKHGHFSDSGWKQQCVGDKVNKLFIVAVSFDDYKKD